MMFLEALLVFILALSLLVLVHEWGHYWVARRAGVRVLRFAIGFGPEIVGTTRGDTRWSICAIPFGGYVRFAGDDPEQDRDQLPDEYLSKGVVARSAIVLAGPVMNYLLAIVLFAVLLAFQGIPVLPDTRVGDVMDGSDAEAAGVRAEDVIRAVDGAPVADWGEFSNALGGIAPGAPFTLTVERGGTDVRLEAVAPADGGFARSPFGVTYRVEPVAGTVKRNGPAWNAGLRPGDRIETVGGQPVDRWTRLVELIRERAGEETEITFSRDGTSLSTRLVPEPTEAFGADGEAVTIGLIGIEPGTEFERAGPVAALVGGWERTWWLTSQVLGTLPKVPGLVAKGLWGMVTGEQAGDEGLGGPVRIAQLFGEAARWGIFHFLAIMASISTQLAIFNLLPIPVLDGGHLVLHVVEVITRRPPSMRVRIVLQQFGFALLLLLMLSVTVMDLGRFFR